MAADDTRRLEEIRDDRLRRLRTLERQQARQGFNTPAEVIVEIAQLSADLGMVEKAIRHPASAETAEAMGAGGRWLATDRKLDQVVQFLSERMDRMEEHSAEWRERERDERIAGQQAYRPWAFVALAISLLAMALAIAAVVLIVVLR